MPEGVLGRVRGSSGGCGVLGAQEGVFRGLRCFWGV